MRLRNAVVPTVVCLQNDVGFLHLPIKKVDFLGLCARQGSHCVSQVVSVATVHGDHLATHTHGVILVWSGPKCAVNASVSYLVYEQRALCQQPCIMQMPAKKKHTFCVTAWTNYMQTFTRCVCGIAWATREQSPCHFRLRRNPCEK